MSIVYKPKKQLAQNFLSDKKVLMKIIDSADISKDDIVLEIGPGQGSMTYHLAQKAKKVIAVEKDIELVHYLEKKFDTLKNLEIVNADILDYLEQFEKGKINNYKIVANIPYYLTSFLLRKVFEMKNKPSEIILMIQKEVAQRIVAKKGEMNMLAVSVQVFAEPEILFYVSKNSFWPKPKVDSAVIKLKIKNEKLKIDEDKFFNLVHTGFGAKRKLLSNNLSKGLDISKEKTYDIFKILGVDVKARAQDLSVNEWIEIYKKVNF
jgi:16S rRNA (adenine1518-N6/adenine1519-N6)-dimethyltransferase